MPQANRLPISMATLAVFGTLLFGMGQRDFLLPVLTFAAAVTSVYFTDIRRWFQLNQTVASIAALAAAGVTLYNFFQINRTEQLLAIAKLLVYLQIVLLYQEKNERVYWQLFMTSLLQVVVAAALNLTVVFGMLLMVYMLVTLVSLSLFFVYRETRRYQSDDAGSTRAPTSPAARGASQQPPPAVAPLKFERIGHGLRPVHWGLLSTMTRMVVTTLIVTVAIFIMVPRTSTDPWRGSAGSPRRVIGFSEEVELGELGEVAQSPEVVMRVQFLEEKTGKPFQVVGEPFLRGSVVTKYTRRNNVSRWTQPNWNYTKSDTWDDALELPRSSGGEPDLVRQEIILEPLDQTVVFCVFPPVVLDSMSDVRYDANRQGLVRRQSDARTQMSLDIGTTGFRGKRQRLIMPQDKMLSSHDLNRLLELPKDDSGELRLSGLHAAAAEEIERARAGDADRLPKARALEAYLRRTGGFTYSLRPVRRDPDLDPIEDFIVNNPVGHCEYFASALALMLRGQGIPSRVVIGFQGGEWNPLGSFYVVRQLHAHTWVEAYLDPEELARRDPQLPGGQLYGGWLRLDPTPPVNDTFGDAEGIIARIGQMTDYLERLWTSYVIGLNAQKQRRAIYLPLAATATSTTELLQSDSLRIELRVAFMAVAKNFWNWFGGDWFSWRGGMVAIGLCFLLLLLFEATRLIARRVRRWHVRRLHAAHGNAMNVPFFLQFKRVLRRHGITRAPGQTPRELATSVGGQLAESPRSRAAAPLPRHIVDAFYRVRFGGRALDSQEAEAVQLALAELDVALGHGSR